MKGGLTDIWLDAARGGRCRLSGRLLVLLFTPLEILYRFGLWVYLLFEKLGLRKRTRLNARVISVGNLTFGGTGKTGVVEVIAGVASRKTKTAVLLRGYGGSSNEDALVVSDGSGAVIPPKIWKQCGDEAAQLASELPDVAVITGKDRRLTGRKAVEEIGAKLVILDDGLQYWQLYRDADIVLIDARCPFGNGRVMPGGIMREPISGLKRAKAVILTHTVGIPDGEVEALRKRVLKIAPGLEIYTANYQPTELISPDGEVQPIGALSRKKIVALCGIGSPQGFFNTLKDCRATICEMLVYPDHYPFTQKDIDTAEEIRKENNAEMIVTTRKDAVRLQGFRLADSLRILRADMDIPDIDKLMKLVTGQKD